MKTSKAIKPRFIRHWQAKRNVRWALVMLIAILAQSFGLGAQAFPGTQAGSSLYKLVVEVHGQGNIIDSEGHAQKASNCHGSMMTTFDSAQQSTQYLQSTHDFGDCCKDGCNMNNCHSYSAIFTEFKTQAMSSEPANAFSLAQFHSSAQLQTPFRPPILTTLG